MWNIYKKEHIKEEQKHILDYIDLVIARNTQKFCDISLNDAKQFINTIKNNFNSGLQSKKREELKKLEKLNLRPEAKKALYKDTEKDWGNLILNDIIKKYSIKNKDFNDVCFSKDASNICDKIEKYYCIKIFNLFLLDIRFRYPDLISNTLDDLNITDELKLEFKNLTIENYKILEGIKN